MMGKPVKKEKGIKFSKSVDTTLIDWDSPLSLEMERSLGEPTMVRISLMVEKDLLEELKRAAKSDPVARGKYQVFMKQILRHYLNQNTGQCSDKLKQEILELVDARVDERLGQHRGKKI